MKKIKLEKNKIIYVYINFNGEIMVDSILTQDIQYLQIENISI